MLYGVLREEPRHLDMRWTTTAVPGELTLQNSRFKDAVADLAAPVRGIPKDELVGEDIRLHRRARTLARAAISALIVLLIAAIVGAVLATVNARQAEQRRIDAEARRLGIEATSLDGPPDLAFTLAAEGYRMRASSATSRALLTTADAAPHVVRIHHDHAAPVSALLVLGTPDTDERVVSADTDGVLLAHDVETGALLARATATTSPVQLLEVPAGSWS